MSYNVSNCQYCNREFITYNGIKHKPKALGLSFDRIDNNKGFEIGNIAVVCYQCNVSKKTWLLKELYDYSYPIKILYPNYTDFLIHVNEINRENVKKADLYHQIIITVINEELSTEEIVTGNYFNPNRRKALF